MRVQFAIALAGLIISASIPAAAQNSVAASENQAAAAANSKAPPAKSKKASKPDGDKICKRLSQGKVCMTAEKWKEYEQQF